jgi:hypothetical protein
MNALMTRFRKLTICWIFIPLFLVICFPFETHAQIDPKRRELVQLGYNQFLEGRGPEALYLFYYLNRPDFLPGKTFRLAAAPIYMDSELGFRHLFGRYTDFGLGLAGGGFSDNFTEVRKGNYFREESFFGHSVQLSTSVYHTFNPRQRIPLFLVLRSTAHLSIYGESRNTADSFVVPDDQATINLRAGLRWGGVEALLFPAVAMELSAWYEKQYRTNPNSYGYNNDRRVEDDSDLFWTRAYLAYTLSGTEHYFNVNITAGSSVSADRFNSYRIGGVLPLIAEFPLILPGFYYQEITADRFALFNTQYALPLEKKNQWNLMVRGAAAVVHYLPGFEQSENWLFGVGGGLTYKSYSEIWKLSLGYDHGINAIRSGGRDAHTISLLFQYDLDAKFHPERRRRPGDPRY